LRAALSIYYTLKNESTIALSGLPRVSAIKAPKLREWKVLGLIMKNY